MKVLWISNAPWAPSGYGSQTRQVGLRIAAAGHDIEFVANDGTRGDQEWRGHLVRGSSGGDRYSRDGILDDYARSEADWVVSLYDNWVYTQGMRDPFESVPRVAGWVPVDHYPVPKVLWRWLANDHMAIAMSQYGFDRLSELSENFRHGEVRGQPPFAVRYAPHGIEPVFSPVDTDFRDVIDVPAEAFLVGIVAANNGTLVYDRKGFGDMVAAMTDLMHARSDVYLYIHSIASGFDAFNLEHLLAFYGVPDDRVRWADQYALRKHTVTDEHMATIYSSLDVLLATSRGEGFGLPVIEAQACGVPVIASNWTAQAELVGDVWSNDRPGDIETPSGWLIGVDPDYDGKQLGLWGKPRISSIIGALGLAYAEQRNGDRWAQRKAAAVAKAAHWAADAVFDRHWRPILDEMNGALDRRPRAVRRAEQRRNKKLRVVA